MTELEHYGVLGMKWGVRKKASSESKTKAAEKAQKKLEKLDAAANAKEEKANYRYNKAITRNKKAEAESAASPVGYVKKNYASFTSSSSGRTVARSMEKRAKAKRWATAMQKTLGDASTKSTALGKKYVDMTLDDITKSTKKINELDDYTRRLRNRYNYPVRIGVSSY